MPTEPGTPTETPVAEVVRWPEPPAHLPVVELDARADEPPVPDRVVALGEPDSPFTEPEHPLEDVLLYDFVTEETEVLGPSLWGGALFSPDGRYLAWTAPRTAGGSAAVIHARDLESDEEHRFDVDRPLFQFLEEHLLLAGERLIDLDTGATRDIELLPDGSSANFDDGLFLRSTLLDKSGGDYTRRWVVWTGLDGEALFEVTGWLVDVLDEETVAVMTAPVEGITTIYLVDVTTLTVQYVAAARQPFPGDLEAGGHHVAWIENACQINDAQDATLGRVRVWDRKSGLITEFEGASFVADVDEGRLAIGAFGPQAWFDIETGEWLAVLPTSGEMAGWSPDLRYASVGRLLGHGGRCG